ncbi:hypothetical protein FA15DRAFT_672669 [Coprinopsis marcescibilis]|uniref:F-box domain-containing protein n=1 Tax=Coprinopsis marcescibilis TaxID=230819 RepID=A0A5C3KMA5_COPMA|nr:hypothetical protein FA15DRAFT_672669 [Coprinopsis marcescibilis]
MAQFPEDIIRELVGHISQAPKQEARETLKAASYVSQIFRRLCQEALFSKITLEIETSSSSPSSCTRKQTSSEKLSQLLEGSPHLATLVNTIVIRDISRSPSLENIERQAIGRSGISASLKFDERLPQALSQLNLDKIKRFTFRQSAYSAWDIHPLPTRHAVARMCAANHLTSLSLRNTSIRLLDSCSPSLTHLKLKYDQSMTPLKASTPQIQTRTQDAPIRLQALHLEGIAQDIPQVTEFLLNNHIDITGLKKLHLRPRGIIQMKTIESLYRLLSACSLSLQSLAYETTREPDDLDLSGYVPFELSKLVNLRELSFGYNHPYIQYNQIKEVRTNPLYWILNLCRTLPESAPLATFYLYVKNWSCGGTVEHSTQAWRELDLIFSDRQRFPLMNRVDIELFSNKSKPNDLDGIQQSIELCVENLTRVGMLDIKQTVLGKYRPFGSLDQC